ncbi:hypothetical protein MPTA5024_18580 [Microbispora sp. ATCC PTA-5024]|nr:hypothetical protein MPTA5024_18580 [Microbispora sp. ATCC PTA-5024]
MPSVVGQTLADAKSALTGAGFKVKTVEQPSDSVPQGNVIDQAPEPGAHRQPGTTITLTVSSGLVEQPTDQPTDQPTEDNPFGN